MTFQETQVPCQANATTSQRVFAGLPLFFILNHMPENIRIRCSVCMQVQTSFNIAKSIPEIFHCSLEHSLPLKTFEYCSTSPTGPYEVTHKRLFKVLESGVVFRLSRCVGWPRCAIKSYSLPRTHPNLIDSRPRW